jgi:hypothetical protein
MEEPIRKICLASVGKRLAAPVVFYYMSTRLPYCYWEDSDLELDTFMPRRFSEYAMQVGDSVIPRVFGELPLSFNWSLGR